MERPRRGGRHPLLSTATGPPPPWSPAGLENPHPWYAEALEGDRVVFDPRADVWHVFRYEDVRELLRDAGTWSTAKRLERVPPEQRIVRLLTSDPPAHTDLRQCFAAAYRPRRLGSLEALIRSRARAHVERAVEAGTFDVVGDVAVPLTREVIGEVIGVPGSDLEECARLAIRNPLGTVEVDAEGEPYPVIWMGAGEPENNRHFNAYFHDLIEERRRHPRDDLVTALAQLELPGAAADGFFNVGALLDEQFGAGQNTTVHLIGTLLAELAQRPAQVEALAADAGRLRGAIEEGLRFWAPLQARPRISTRPVRIGTTDLPEGAVGLAWTQAANLDPRQFDDPRTFDTGRADNAHLTFGFGPHFCLGAPLARLEVRILLEEWFARIGSFERADDGPLEWMDSYMMRGLVRLRVSAVRRGRHGRGLPRPEAAASS